MAIVISSFSVVAGLSSGRKCTVVNIARHNMVTLAFRSTSVQRPP